MAPIGLLSQRSFPQFRPKLRRGNVSKKVDVTVAVREVDLPCWTARATKLTA